MSKTQNVILSLFEDFGSMSHYATYHAARAAGYKFSPSSVRTRCSELVRAGVLKDSGLRERTPSGRFAVVWTTV